MSTSPPAYRESTGPSGTPLYVPRVGTLEAVLRHWPLVLLPLLVFLGASLALGLQRDPVYKSETRMAVGGIDVSQPGALSGLALAGESLSTTYSRAIDAEAIVFPVAQQLGVSPGSVRSRVSATPVPNSPVFRITAEGTSAEDAQRLANTAASSMQRYVSALTRPGERSDALFAEYRRAAQSYYEIFADKQAAERRFGSTGGDDARAQMIELRGEANAARLRMQGLQENYLKSINARSSSPGVEQLSKAAGATSDRNEVIQLYLFIGAVAGLLAGLALATLRANRMIRRRLTT